MELRTAMTTTPATRAFLDDDLPDETLFDILDHARFAPNGGNRQAWHVTIVRDRDLKGRVAELWELAQREDHAFYEAGLVPFVASEAYWRNPPGQPSVQPIDLEAARASAPSRSFGTPAATIASAPVLLIVSVDLAKMTAMDSGLGRLSIAAGGSVYPFAHNILLAARDSGFGGVVTTVLVRQEPAVRALLHVPDGHAVACAIPLGRPVREIIRLRRNPVAEFATVGTFDGPAFTSPTEGSAS
jgi:nitroreductase